MDSRGIPIVVQTTKKLPTTPNRSSLTPNRTPKRHDTYIYPSLKDEKSLLDAYDSFSEACFQSHYNHSMLTEDCRYNIHDLFKSDCYAVDNNVPDSPTSHDSQSKRMRSSLAIDTDPPEAQVPNLEMYKKLKTDSMSTKMDIVSSPIEATTPMGEDMEEALDTIMNTATLQQQKQQHDRESSIATEQESAPFILNEKNVLPNLTYPDNQADRLVTRMDTHETLISSISSTETNVTSHAQIEPHEKSAVVKELEVPTKVPVGPIAENPGTPTNEETPVEKPVIESVSTSTKQSTKPVVKRRVTRSQVKDKKVEFAVPELPPTRRRACSRKKKMAETPTNEAEHVMPRSAAPTETNRSVLRSKKSIETPTKEAEHDFSEEKEPSITPPIETKKSSPRRKKVLETPNEPPAVPIETDTVNKELTKEAVERQKYEAQRKKKIKKEISNLLERFPSLAEYYQLIDRTGCGTFSRVYKAKDLRANHYVSGDKQEESSKYVAIKLILDISTPERVANEIQCLLSLRFLPGITSLITAFRKESLTFVVLPHVEFDHFDNFYQDMTLSDTRSYLSELLIGLQSTHQTGIMHRDVKPGNFLYNTKTKRGYLADFGLAQQSSLELYTPKPNYQLPDSQIEYTQDQAGYYHNDSRPPLQADRSGTKGFRAPEVMVRFKHQTTAVDMWAVGVILLVILSGRYPFFEPEDDADGILELGHIFGLKKMMEFSQFYGRTLRTNIPTIPEQALDFESYLRKINLDRVEKWDPEEFKLAIDLMRQCLQLIHTDRISATEALKHPFFQTKNQLQV